MVMGTQDVLRIYGFDLRILMSYKWNPGHKIIWLSILFTVLDIVLRMLNNIIKIELCSFPTVIKSVLERL